jgi:hypothetical protein
MKEKINFVLEWVATIIAIAGAILTSMNVYPLNIILSLCGCTLFVIWFFRIGKLSLMLVNLTFIIIYIFGIFFNTTL